jgi:hypothetical protein
MLGELRNATRALPDDTPLLVGIRDRHHFDHLLGDLVVSAVAVEPGAVERGARQPVVVLDVRGLS